LGKDTKFYGIFLEKSGKTMLLQQLRGKKGKKTEYNPTKGIEVDKFDFELKDEDNHKTTVSFSTFDFSGSGITLIISSL
jgi:hypothetical protein